jgi:hypothetical protein
MADSVPSDPRLPLVAPLGAGNSNPGRDTRPTYPAAQLVADVQALLATAGIQPNANVSAHVAGMAAADLLRALGVRPVSVTAVPPKRSPAEPVMCQYCGRMPGARGRIEHVRGCRAEAEA